ncbi:SDR family NAD(P)-dependent oxidoreductase [Paucibacter sp. O1-1]|nr:SDR family oxidoreductase [Paucibacter sp. O1-1]MDA3830938.1 SDR family NAD(P)-dependent oxidoreductase [Paucibacter sp. O1-1]
MADTLRQRYGRCDILVNCAGTTRFVPHPQLDALDDALFDQILATNIRGPFAAVRALRPLLAAPRSVAARAWWRTSRRSPRSPPWAATSPLRQQGRARQHEQEPGPCAGAGGARAQRLAQAWPTPIS